METIQYKTQSKNKKGNLKPPNVVVIEFPQERGEE